MAATAADAPRWIPKRGEVLRRVLKKLFYFCLCSAPALPPPTRSSSRVFPH
uniref:Uncharacterized protein n=1 Tax=Cucumis melo TaxID=3656 RepID=A0A9I9CKU5_CUCME